MRYLKLLGFAVSAVLVLGVAVVSTAQAASLELLPEGAKFTFKSAVGVPTVLRTLAGKVVECASATGNGEATSKRLGAVEFKFVGCKNPTIGVKCTGLETGDKEGEILFKAEYHIRHLLESGGSKPIEAVSLMILVGHVHFSCLGILFLVLGSVCSDDLEISKGGGTAVNKLISSAYVNFLESGEKTGDPKVTEVDGDNSLSMEACVLLTKEGTNEANKYDTSSQKGEGVLEGCKKGTETVTCLIDLKEIF